MRLGIEKKKNPCLTFIRKQEHQSRGAKRANELTHPNNQRWTKPNNPPLFIDNQSRDACIGEKGSSERASKRARRSRTSSSAFLPAPPGKIAASSAFLPAPVEISASALLPAPGEIASYSRFLLAPAKHTSYSSCSSGVGGLGTSTSTDRKR